MSITDKLADALRELPMGSAKARAALAALQQAVDENAKDALDFEPDEQHSVADMANVGYSLMQAIKTARPGYAWCNSPAEIVSDLVNDLDEAKAALQQAQQPGAPAVTFDGLYLSKHDVWHDEPTGAADHD